MKHATEGALVRLNGLLAKLREHDGLKERKRGVFYRKSNAFIHFHEDDDDLFVDLRIGSGWERLPVNTKSEWKHFLSKVDDELSI